MTTPIKAYKRYVKEAFEFLDLERAPPKYVQWMNFNNFGLKCQFAHFQGNMELHLNRSIHGVQDKCVNKIYVMHMTYISHNSRIKEVN
jgi:hypothetical protein